MKDSKPTIAVFDFDGTITSKDTLMDFIAYYRNRPALIAGLLLNSPKLVLTKLGFYPPAKAKKIILSYFFRDEQLARFSEICFQYSTRIDQIVKREAIEKIKWHISEGHTVVIDSASPENWIKPWAEKNGISHVIATKLKVKNSVITGEIDGKNCRDYEKVNRLLELYPNRDEYILYAYGDSNGDKELLSFADYPFFRTF